MMRVVLQRAYAKVTGLLQTSSDVEGMLARRESGRAAPEDEGLLRTFVEKLLAEQREDGSWGEDLSATGLALQDLHLLLEGDPERAGPELVGAFAWLGSRQGRPGQYGDRCEPEQHALGLCRHFLGGFFAPAEGQTAGLLALPCGLAELPESDAKLASSCIALRGALLWRSTWPEAWQQGGKPQIRRSDVLLHLDGLCRVISFWNRGETVTDCSNTAVFLGLQALLAVEAANLGLPVDLAATCRQTLESGLCRTARIQRADGSWPDVDAFLGLDLLEKAARSDSPALKAASLRGAELLVSAQQADGSWGRESPPRRQLVAWRALRRELECSEPD